MDLSEGSTRMLALSPHSHFPTRMSGGLMAKMQHLICYCKWEQKALFTSGDPYNIDNVIMMGILPVVHRTE